MKIPAGSDLFSFLSFFCFVPALRQDYTAFTVQMRIQYDCCVSVVDTRPPTAAQTDLQPRAEESLEMLCIIHAHTCSICTNTHFLVSTREKLSSHERLGKEPDLR